MTTSQFSTRFFALFVALGIVALLYRAQTTGAPIMASDEYAFNIVGRYPGVDLYQLDPLLQRVDNRLTFALQHAWARLDTGHGVAMTRLVHIMEWLLACGLLLLSFRGVVSDSARRLGAVASFLLPCSFYALTVLPETDLIFMAALLGSAMIVLGPQQPVIAAGLAGVVSGIALLLKPHAIAWVPAVLLTLTATAFIERTHRERTTRLLLAVGVCLVGWYAGFLSAWRFAAGTWSFNPADALGLRFYGGYAASFADARSLVANGSHIAAYLLGHILVLGLIFGPALAYAVQVCYRAVADAKTSPAANSAVFVLSMLVCHLAMVAHFTASAAAANPGEAMRLHGRYLGVALIFLPFFYFQFLFTASARAGRWAAMAGGLVALLFGVVVARSFKIFPWDYPELFAFYSSPNSYGWTYGVGSVWLGRALLVLCFAGLLACAIRPKLTGRVLTVQLFVVLCTGHLQMQRWLAVHMEANGNVINIGEALGRLLSPAAPGDGVVIGDQRYGYMSYLLFALGNAPRVIVRDSGSLIQQREVAGAKWVLATRPYDARFSYRTAVKLGEFVLYPLLTTSPAISVAAKVPWGGEPFEIRLAADAGTSSVISGFNLQEAWGAWTSLDVAEIDLPSAVSGRIRIRTFGWVLPDSVGIPVRFALGDQVRALSMTGAGAEYVLEFDVRLPTDRLRITIPAIRPERSERSMGVALRDLHFERF